MTYVKVLDADDQLTPGCLARDLAALEADPAIGWATSRVLDLLPDGSTVGFEGDPAGGPLERGEVLAHWKAHDFRARYTRPPSSSAATCSSRSADGWRCPPRRTPACCSR